MRYQREIPGSESELESLLEYLKRTRGFDFTAYKRASIARRIEKRMIAVGANGFAEYGRHLEINPEEYPLLFRTVLINVTSFFRDEASWKYLADQVLPELLARKGSSAKIRVWSAGCASGEEAYTMAIMLAQAMGMEAFTRRVRISGTDVDGHALRRARRGVYSAREVACLQPVQLDQYFIATEGGYAVREDLRRRVSFSRRDLIGDGPMKRVDLIVCRNTLMYLNAETQARILAGFHRALNDGGILFLGRAETLLTYARAFQPIDLKRRISTKVPA